MLMSGQKQTWRIPNYTAMRLRLHCHRMGQWQAQRTGFAPQVSYFGREIL